MCAEAGRVAAPEGREPPPHRSQSDAGGFGINAAFHKNQKDSSVFTLWITKIRIEQPLSSYT